MKNTNMFQYSVRFVLSRRFRTHNIGTEALTLVELMVTLALIGTLSAMLFPVFAAAREKGRQTTCLSNLRQLGASMSLYAQDYDGLYPYGADALDKMTFIWGVNPKADPVLKDMPYLHDVLTPYIQNREVWRCASDTGFDTLLDHPDPSTGEPVKLVASPSAFETFGSSYAYRTELAFRQKLYATSGYWSGHEVGPEKISVLTEITGAWHGSGPSMDNFTFIALMGDGHVRRQNLGQSAISGAISLEQPSGTQ